MLSRVFFFFCLCFSGVLYQKYFVCYVCQSVSPVVVVDSLSEIWLLGKSCGAVMREFQILPGVSCMGMLC